MSRRAVLATIFSLLVMNGCAKKGGGAPPLPETVSGGWRRTSLEEGSADAAPELVRRAGLRTWWKAQYEGPGVVHVQAYELNTGAAGLDLMQKWRPAANTVTFYSDRYFTVVDWDRAEREPLRGLIARLQKGL